MKPIAAKDLRNFTDILLSLYLYHNNLGRFCHDKNYKEN
jgi:hypothetical protein